MGFPWGVRVAWEVRGYTWGRKALGAFLPGGWVMPGGVPQGLPGGSGGLGSLRCGWSLGASWGFLGLPRGLVGTIRKL